jgi:type II restriction enzyme
VDLALDPSTSLPYHSPTQTAKALTEHWVAREGYCLRCGDGSLDPTPENTRALDFRCAECDEPYELKASRRPFRRRVLDGEYGTFRRAIASLDNPNLLLLNYDLAALTVTDLWAIPRYALSRLAVIPRKPLGPSARRAGWQGCSIDLSSLPRAALVRVVCSGEPRPPGAVLEDWAGLEFIERTRGTNREWLPDVLSCIRRIPTEEFDLPAAYAFERELRLLHPRNKNVEPKMRQQLQILVAQGVLARTRPGRYRKTARI